LKETFWTILKATLVPTIFRPVGASFLTRAYQFNTDFQKSGQTICSLQKLCLTRGTVTAKIRHGQT
jgi:hypothetical protein